MERDNKIVQTQSQQIKYIRDLPLVEINRMSIEHLERVIVAMENMKLAEWEFPVEVLCVETEVANTLAFMRLLHKQATNFKERFTDYVLQGDLEERNPFQRDAIIHYIKTHVNDFSTEVRKKVTFFLIGQEFEEERIRTEKKARRTKKNSK